MRGKFLGSSSIQKVRERCWESVSKYLFAVNKVTGKEFQVTVYKLYQELEPNFIDFPNPDTLNTVNYWTAFLDITPSIQIDSWRSLKFTYFFLFAVMNIAVTGYWKLKVWLFDRQQLLLTSGSSVDKGWQWWTFLHFDSHSQTQVTRTLSRV